MKIAFIFGATGYESGLYNATIDTVNEIRAQGHLVDYIFWDDKKRLKDNDQCINLWGISNKSISSKIFIKIVKNIFGYHFYYLLFSKFFSNQLTKYVNKNEYDIIFFHGTNYLPFYSYKGKSYVVLHSCKYENLINRHKGIKKYFYTKLYRKLYSNKNILTVSNDSLIDMLDKVKAKPLTIDTIYNGFNFENMENVVKNSHINGLPDKFIMAAGRPDRTKRFDILLKAYAKSLSKEEYKLVIFGEGKRTSNLKRLARELNIEDNVIFAGFISPLLPVFKYASLYVLSSDIEGLPTVIIESLVSKTPVVATAAGGVNELLSGDLNQYVVPCGDIDALSEKIDLALGEPPTVSSQNVAYLDYKIVAQRYIDKAEELK
ncbi:glycosyltransferase [Photobacterium leiognathi]|uniref:glycosyltransferase n=1 Tax=Photobacterium leiognathi TaxID=553611 RepID=UPI002981101B|nr:glycosyltransferase [Photobacterium leiognathi]